MVVIRPAGRWRLADLHELWQYRELAWTLALRDVQVRYRQTFVGLAWSVIKPVLTMVVFSIVFGRIAGIPSGDVPYPVFLYAALLPWQFFSNALTASANSVLASRDLITRVYFPRLVVPIASIGACLLDMLVATSVLFALMAWYGMAPGLHLLLALPLLVLVMITALGAGTLVAALAVRYRDFVHLLPFAMQLWLFLTPVVYGSASVPEELHWLLVLNPMTGVVEGFRAAFLGVPLDPGTLASGVVAAVVVALAGILVFERVERTFADVI